MFVSYSFVATHLPMIVDTYRIPPHACKERVCCLPSLLTLTRSLSTSTRLYERGPAAHVPVIVKTLYRRVCVVYSFDTYEVSFDIY